jgi:hypothetical protein
VDSHKKAFPGFLILLFNEGNVDDDDDYGIISILIFHSAPYFLYFEQQFLMKLKCE